MRKLLKSLAKRSDPIIAIVAIGLITGGLARLSLEAAMIAAGVLLWVDVYLTKTKPRGRHGRVS